MSRPGRKRPARYTGPMQEFVRHDWTAEQVQATHDLPLFELIDRAREVHLQFHPRNEVQLCTLLSIKTGGCVEDCAYCSQSSHYSTPVKPQAMLRVEDVVEAAKRAKLQGATRFCMGAAWREVRGGPAFERALEMIRRVKDEGLETCVTLGMLTSDQARALRAAGLDCYNHNVDTSREYYSHVVTTRSYEDRLRTIRCVREAGISVCTGGIIGLGETLEDRCRMLVELSSLNPHPESVPINSLVRVEGTPLGEGAPRVDPMDMLRMIATARIVLPKAKVRLSAGRNDLPRETQLFCMYAGANSIFYGEELLTTQNAGEGFDDAMLKAAGLVAQRPKHEADRVDGLQQLNGS